MGLFGLDVRQIQDMSGSMDREAEAIRAVLADLRGKMSQIQWLGPDADRFRSEWSSQQPRLNEIVNSLHTTARQARENAERQDRISRQ
ncbi:MAG: WXG100 family type VII secretion target [Bifidobacteriaceae bacterium]|jgi:uncharacterized protein YukE|nr:WXG100 family type VII secretion target [Bifidobacteriaceae bacterium]